jgi:transcriptional regulator with XRE-family HTH domain
MNSIGNNIRLLRLRLGIPQERLAKKVGCTQAHISEIEHGKGVSVSLLLKIRSVLGCSITDIID